MNIRQIGKTEFGEFAKKEGEGNYLEFCWKSGH
jgi:hypothetical protein